MRAWALVAGGAVAVGGGVSGLVARAAVTEAPPGDDQVAEEAAAATSTAEVTRRDLARREELDGTVGYGDAAPLVLAATGTLTQLPAAGDVLEPGDIVAMVDGQPIVLVDGAFPFWRTLGPGVDDGADVLQLEYLLATLGYAQEHDVTVDEEWTSATTEAVEAFQEDHEMVDDGVVDLGELVTTTEPLRVAAVGGVPGQGAAEAAITVTTTELSIALDLDIGDADLLAAGDQVEVELASGEVVTATVASIGAAQANENGPTTLPVMLHVDGDIDATLPEGAPVEVIVEVAAAEDVLAVPVEALLAVSEGGYAVEVVDGAATRLVGVELGVFADGLVAVSGDLEAGDQVVVP